MDGKIFGITLILETELVLFCIQYKISREKETTELKAKESQIDELKKQLEDFKKESLNEIEKLKWINQIKSAYIESGELPKIQSNGNEVTTTYKSINEIKKRFKNVS